MFFTETHFVVELHVHLRCLLSQSPPEKIPVHVSEKFLQTSGGGTFMYTHPLFVCVGRYLLYISPSPDLRNGRTPQEDFQRDLLPCGTQGMNHS